MNPDHVAAQVRERSGMDVQAVTLVRSGAGNGTMPAVWAAMTELGHFWAVEDGTTIELFRAVARRTSPNDLHACHSAVEAARRFLMLHPPPAGQRAYPADTNAESMPEGVLAAAEPEAETSAVSATCQACGTPLPSGRFGHRARVTANAKSLCARCRHAERERLRYQQDPTYRAKRLAYSAARYRRSQLGADADV